jgi:hypothetical protein
MESQRLVRSGIENKESLHRWCVVGMAADDEVRSAHGTPPIPEYRCSRPVPCLQVDHGEKLCSRWTALSESYVLGDTLLYRITRHDPT